MKVIETERLILRTWEEKDIEIYYNINQDPKVLEFIPGPITREDVENFISSMNRQFQEKNFTLWAVEEKLSKNFIGFIGLNQTQWKTPFTPCVDIGWRLGSEHWGKGYAQEGAKASLHYGFEKCNLQEIVAFTVAENIRSRNVMEKIGMKHDITGDFPHPRLPLNHKLSRHVLYRIQNPKK